MQFSSVRRAVSKASKQQTEGNEFGDFGFTCRVKMKIKIGIKISCSQAVKQTNLSKATANHQYSMELTRMNIRLNQISVWYL